VTLHRTDAVDGAVSLGEVSVLLVDDDPTWARTAGRLLERHAAAVEVTTATGLSAAREAFATLDPDCVVCDYRLGDGTGLDLLAEVREAAPDRPFVLVTGEGSEAVASEAIGRQVTDYVRKAEVGEGSDLLARRVVGAVRSHRTERALARERRSKEAMLDIVTETTARDDLASAFCRHLVTEHDYACAWLGVVSDGDGPAAGTPIALDTQAVAGAENYPDAVVADADADETGEPAVVALGRREPYVVDSLSTGTGGGDADGTGSSTDATGAETSADAAPDWRPAAAEHGFESGAAVPVAYEGTILGVLAVYATEAGAVGDREMDLLAECADTVAYAFQTTEWKRSLLSPTATAAEVEVGDEAPLVALATRVSGAIDVRSVVLRDDGHLLYLARVADADPDEVRTAAEAVEAVRSVEVSGGGGADGGEVSGGESLRCELLVETPTPESVLVEQGVRVTGTRVRHRTATVSFVCPADGDVTAVTDALQSVYADASAVTIRSKAAAGDPDVVPDVREALTDKQRQALELAYHQGYFERPREHNATELAEKLDVTRATFTQHVRSAHRKLVSRLLGEQW